MTGILFELLALSELKDSNLIKQIFRGIFFGSFLPGSSNYIKNSCFICWQLGKLKMTMKCPFYYRFQTVVFHIQFLFFIQLCPDRNIYMKFVRNCGQCALQVASAPQRQFCQIEKLESPIWISASFSIKSWRRPFPSLPVTIFPFLQFLIMDGIAVVE